MRVLAILMWFACAPAFAQDKITIVADEWPPFSGAELPNGGISLDVISTVLTKAGYSVTTEVLPWARIMDGAPKGEYDIVGSLFFDPEIAEYMTYSAPFFETDVKFMRRAGDTVEVSGIDSLGDLSIAVGDGFLYEENFDRADHLNKVTVITALQAIQMVAFGRADLTLDSEEVLNYAVRTLDPSLEQQTEILPYVLTTHAVHMAVGNTLDGKDQLVSDFNRVLNEMRADGSLDDLLQKHLRN